MSKRSFTNEQYVKAVKNSISWHQVFKYLNLKVGGSQYIKMKQIATELNVDTSHFLGQGWNKNNISGFLKHKTISLSEILIKNSNFLNTHRLKLKLIKKGIKTRMCEICNLTEWNNKPIPIQLDHINGDRTDNRIENLRILCPNCHAQTPTYCRGKLKSKKLPGKQGYKRPNLCINCQTPVGKKAKRCPSCHCKNKISKNRPTKISWPEPQRVLQMVKNTSFSQVGHKLGVSDNAVRKYLNRHKLIT